MPVSALLKSSQDRGLNCGTDFAVLQLIENRAGGQYSSIAINATFCTGMKEEARAKALRSLIE